MSKFNYLKNLDEVMRDFFSNYVSYTYPLNKVMGETKTESGVDENGEWTKTVYQTPDGSYSSVSFIRFGSESNTPVVSESKKVSSLKKELDTLIKNQDFEKACEVRDQIKKLETNKSEIEKLRKELEDSIKNENFEDSIKLRDKIKKLEK